MDSAPIEERIRTLAKNTDSLIVRLDTLSSRIDTARVNENQELVEYYERQFAEASVEFMDGVETILDEWYALKGIPRPPADQEILAPEMLDEIHGAVVAIVQGMPAAPATVKPLADEDGKELDASIAAPEPTALTAQGVTKSRKKGPGGKVDLKG
jgi:hypothetical protein